ncbi:peptidoglycan-binding protein [Roseicyclus amphidinii]|uniref:peptidoglycan-binding protein n=1 Tax=Roseicyclus amphidinii TaxID=3034232 RepID=UPI0024E13E46|nr:peptidoglycan-binding protein [Roseicyclus sp. Amp-Y-6]
MRALIPALIPFALALGAATQAGADTALLIANDRYGAAQNLNGGDEILSLEGPLDRAGFDVIVVENGTAEALRAAVSALLEAEESERVLVALSGHLLHSAVGTWLLGTDAERPDLATVGAEGIALDVLFEIAARAPGRAVVLLGQEMRRIEPGAGLARGLGVLEAPQGVTIVTGATDALADLARDVLLRPGADLAEALEEARGLRAVGFVSPALPFLPVPPVEAEEQGEAEPPTGPSEEEAALWAAVQELNTPGSYRAYLEQFPAGVFAGEARDRVAALEAEAADPVARAEAAEAALSLGRSQRQQIQRDLSLLGYNTRGIDGIFGPGTRGAIRGWQGARGFEVTGFLTGPQIAVLREAASRRAAELEEEARLQREAQAQADRAFWQATGQGRDEAALRAYLSRYPDGLFSEVAQARLDEIDAARMAEVEAQEERVWEEVRAADSVAAYRRYLELYPGGQFADVAQSRLSVLETGLTPRELSLAEAREAALNLTPQMRQLAEQRLAALGIDPGRVDGRFDGRARAAIREYQRSRGMGATGYLDQMTVVRLLAEAIGGRIFE